MVDIAEPDEVAVIDGPHYFTRELSLLKFHSRVLDQARGTAHP